MIWGNGWAWLGLLAVVVPIVVHLLTRREVRPVAFPAVRFLPVTVPAATRRRRVDDWLRLLFRCGIVALAAAALAQPWLATPGRMAAAGGTVFRAVVVDASESMARPADDGRPGLEVARETAGTLAGDANLSRVIETANLAGGIEAARVWIDRTARGSRSEIVVISDFQAGAFDRADLMRLAPETGVTLRRVAVRAGGDVALAAVTIGGETFRPSVTLAGDGTAVRWTTVPPATGEWSLESLSAPADSAAAENTVGAARDVTAVRAGAPNRPVTIVWPGAPARESMLTPAGEPLEPWMADIVRTLPGPLSAASRRDAAGSPRLYLFPDAAPGTVDGAALAAAVLRTAAPGVASLAEHEPAFVADDVLAGLERDAAPVAARAAAGAASDARWVWLAVLVLVWVEGRRRAR